MAFYKYIATSMYRENSKNIYFKYFCVLGGASLTLDASDYLKGRLKTSKWKNWCATLYNAEMLSIRWLRVQCSTILRYKVQNSEVTEDRSEIDLPPLSQCTEVSLACFVYFRILSREEKVFPYLFCINVMFVFFSVVYLCSIFTKFVFVHMSLCFLVLVLCFLVCLFVFLCLWRCLIWKLATPTQESLPYTFSVWFALLNMFQAQLVEVQTQRNAPN